MMVLQYPHPLLRKKIEYDSSLDENEVISELRRAADLESIKHKQKILGLAANQIGIETRIILYRSLEYAPDQYRALINPKILWESDYKTVEVEGCGSIPGYEVEVARSRWMKIDAQREFNTSKHYPDIFVGWDARIIAHEIDHLNGVLLFDRELHYEDSSAILSS